MHNVKFGSAGTHIVASRITPMAGWKLTVNPTSASFWTPWNPKFSNSRILRLEDVAHKDAEFLALAEKAPVVGEVHFIGAGGNHVLQAQPVARLDVVCVQNEEEPTKV